MANMQNRPSKTDTNSFAGKLEASLKVLNETLDRYSLCEVFLSFNGGKDCTVLLHMVDTVMAQRLKLSDKKLLCLYIQPLEPFMEIEEFVEMCKVQYRIHVESPKEGNASMQTALIGVCAANPKLKACLMGCRTTDPYCEKLGTYEETTAGWPALMRVNPLLDWTCQDIWHYIRTNNVPYCSLYDVGYTSLGDKTNTVPNPHLKYVNATTGCIEYRPAYELENADELERVGRFIPPKQSKINSASDR